MTSDPRHQGSEPSPTYRIFDGRRWHGPFRREELPAQGLRPDSLVQASNAPAPTRADLLSDVQPLLDSSVPMATPAGGTLLPYQALPPGTVGWTTHRAWAFTSLALTVGAWAVVMPLCEGVPEPLRRVRVSLGLTPLLVAAMALGLSAVACGTLGMTNPAICRMAALARFGAWMSPVVWCLASWVFCLCTDTDRWFRSAAMSRLVYSFALVSLVAWIIDGVLDRLTAAICNHFLRPRP